MKKFTILLAAALALACSSIYPTGDRPIVAEMAASLAADPRRGDPGLTMLRDPHSRLAVEGFYEEVAGDSQVSRAILKYADHYDIPLPLAFALAWGESEFYTLAFNRNPGSVDRGLFQLNSLTFPKLTADEFYDPELNARLGLRHLRFCLDESSSELVALAMYNAGARKVRKGTPYSTLNHIARILDCREALEKDFLHELGGMSALLARRPAPASGAL